MRYAGLPAAKTVEQSILLAQLQILRKMETEGVVQVNCTGSIRTWVEAGENEGADL
jgi:hypothetical protein